MAALSQVLGQSEQSLEKWVDSSEDNFSLTPENFAKWVRRYLDGCEANHQMMFLVDEVGQFIGGDGHLMLSLQTITEQLGTVCEGRAWVVVTSQEDLDAVLGDLKSTKQHDFSKIQGRFRTRLSLSSRNVDEVIKKRLLAKTEPAKRALEEAYQGKHDILKNQLSFTKTGHTFKTFHDAADFIEAYPFAAYQFHLVQKVFESIRKAGATGLHLSQGERSTLDAFQSAARQLAKKPVGALAPFYAFYPAVEGFLDTAVKRTIDQTDDNASLQKFDGTLLKVLFLIRYIDVLPGIVDNLVTLCVDLVDADRLQLRQQIEASLNRLEQETLISRNGELYHFLTNEERDIGREIKNISINSAMETKLLGELLFDELLGGQVKHTYSKTKRDFAFNRLCDEQPLGQKKANDLEVALVTPLSDDYANLQGDGPGVMHTTQHQGRVLLCLPDNPELGRELRTYLQTESYVRTKNTGTLPESTKRILSDRSDENRTRRKRILQHLSDMLESARYYAAGAKVEPKSQEPRGALGEALEYLIANAYPKMGYIESISPNPKPEIQRLLKANDLEERVLDLGLGETNPKALSELRDYLRLCQQTHRQVVLYDLVEEKFARRPFGWPQLEIVLLVTRLFVSRELELQVNARPLKRDEAYDYLTSSQKQRSVVVTLRQSADTAMLKKARALGHELFAEQGPEEEAALFEFLKVRLTQWHIDLVKHKPMAEEGGFPGAEQIQNCLGSLRPLLAETDSLRFLKRWTEESEGLHELAEDIQELNEFYSKRPDERRSHQLESWKALQLALSEFRDNCLQLEQEPAIAGALARLIEIGGHARPYALLREVEPLVSKVRAVNERLLGQARAKTQAELERLSIQVREDLEKVAADDLLRQRATHGLEKLTTTLASQKSIPHLAQVVEEAELEMARALKLIEESIRPKLDVAPVAVTNDTQREQATATLAKPSPPAPPAFKPVRRVEVKSLSQKTFLETQEDVDAFLSELRQELERAIDNNERVQIK